MKELEELIRNPPWIMRPTMPYPESLEEDIRKTQDYFAKLSEEFDRFKKDVVCIKRKKLQGRVDYIRSNPKMLEHDVCCVNCLEKGELMAYENLLKGDAPQKEGCS